MNKDQLLADLRNKLSPIKNYLTSVREFENICSQKPSFYTGIRRGQLSVLIEKEKLRAEAAMPKVELIIEQLENLD